MKKLSLHLAIASVILAGCSYEPVKQALNPKVSVSAVQSTPLPLRTDIEQGVLDNGMKYIVLPNAEPANRVSIQLIVHAGSLDEADDQKGIAHLVEHMAFNGTDKFPGNSIIEHQESLGMVFGRDVNAMTEYSTTSYYLNLPDNSDRILDDAFDMLSQQVSALTFDPLELEKERPVVEEEWRRSLSMMGRLGTANRKITLAGSRFSEREPIGDMELVRHIGADRIKAFYDDWYHPNNMTLLVVGSIDKTQVEKRLEKYFAPLPSATLPSRSNLTIPLAESLTFETIADDEITTEVFSVNLRSEQPEAHTEEALKAQLISALALTMLDSRLQVQYQTEGDYVSKLVASSTPLATGYSNERVMAILKDGNYQQGLKELFTEISRYAAHGFSQRDLDTARKGFATRYKAMADNQKTAKNRSLMMGLFNQIRAQKPLMHTTDFNNIVQRLLPEITLEETNQYFKQAINSKAPLVIAQINRKNRDKQPDQTVVQSLWQTSLRNPPPALVQQTVSKTLFDQQPPAAEVVSHEQEGDIHKWTLANGAQIWFQKSDKANQQVQLRWQGFGGTMQLPVSERRAATLATRNLASFGYAGMDAEALSIINADHNLRLITYVDLTRQGVFGSAGSDSLEVWLQNLNLMLTQPQVDPAIWKAKQTFLARSLDRRQDNPSSQFSEQIDRLRFVNSPSLQPITSEELLGINAKQMLAAYRSLFGTAAGHQLVVIGDVEANEVIDLASRYLGRLPAGTVHEEPRLPKLATGKHRVLVEGGQEPQGVTSVLFNADYPFSQEARNQAYLLTRIVSLRMREQLREEAGGVYTSSFGIQLERARQQAYGMVSYSHQPERADELKQMALAIIADVAAKGITQEELNTIREQILSGLKPEVITDRDRYRWLTQMAADDEFLELPDSYLEWLNQVTPAQLEPMASSILRTGNVIDALLLPEKKNSNG